jgi:hypothetical protein
MRKLSLNVDMLDVQSFETARPEAARGTVLGNDATNNPRNCGDTSIADNCETGLCTPVTCPDTYNECPSAYDACASSRGCTEIDC